MAVLSSPALNSSSWTPIGPAPIKTGGGLIYISGRVEAIAPHPTAADILFAGSDGGGLWQTTNATASPVTWTPLTDSQPSLNFSLTARYRALGNVGRHAPVWVKAVRA
jgi:hypothetical protein